MSERKLRAWEAAGVIDAATAARIRSFEASHARPLGLWAVIGIAALSIGLGLISVVAANWDDIPGLVRLSIHFAAMAGLALWLWRQEAGLAARQPWLHEAALFVLGILGLTFMGHIGQVYQTSSPLWQPLVLWLVLFAPLLLLRGLSWLTAALVMVFAVIAGWNHAFNLLEMHPEPPQPWLTIRVALATTLPVLAAGLAAWARGRSARASFWHRLEQLALAYAVGGASVCTIAAIEGPWYREPDGEYVLLAAVIAGLAGLASAALLHAFRRDESDRMSAAVLAGAAAMPLVCFALSGDETLAALLFMALWAGIALAALRGGWRGVFQMAVAMIALRLVILSFELAGDLLTSGAGLIASGLLILGIAWGAVRVSRRFAPVEAENAP